MYQQCRVFITGLMKIHYVHFYNVYFKLYSKQDIDCIYYIEIPQEVKCYYTWLLPCSTKTVNTLCNTTDGLINAHLCNWSVQSYY